MNITKMKFLENREIYHIQIPGKWGNLQIPGKLGNCDEFPQKQGN